MKLIKEVKTIQHALTQEELVKYSKESSNLNLEIEDLKKEAKNVASEYANKVKVAEAKRAMLSQKIITGFESKDVFVYQRKNFIISTIEFISMDGEIISTKPFEPRDYKKQLELKEELAINKAQRIEYFGMKYFYEKFLEINFEIDVTAEQVNEQLETNRTKFVSTAITYLVEKNILALNDDDSVEFDSIYEVVSEWYDKFKTKYMEEPKEEDYIVEEQPIEEEKDPESPDVFPVNLPEKPKPKKGEGKKGKKKNDSQEGDNEEEDLSGDPDYIED